MDNQDIEANEIANIELCREKFIEIWMLGAETALEVINSLLHNSLPITHEMLFALYETRYMQASYAALSFEKEIKEAAKLLINDKNKV